MKKSSSPPKAARPRPPRTIPPLVLLSFAVIHSQVYWLYSVMYHLYHNLSYRPLDLDDSVHQALTRRSGRLRAFSEPQQASSVQAREQQRILAHPAAAVAAANVTPEAKSRPRSSTISASTVDADEPLRRQQWLRQFHARMEQQELAKEVQPDDRDASCEALDRFPNKAWWQRRGMFTPSSSSQLQQQPQGLNSSDEGLNGSVTAHHSVSPFLTSLASGISSIRTSSADGQSFTPAACTTPTIANTTNTTTNSAMTSPDHVKKRRLARLHSLFKRPLSSASIVVSSAPVSPTPRRVNEMQDDNCKSDDDMSDRSPPSPLMTFPPSPPLCPIDATSPVHAPKRSKTKRIIHSLTRWKRTRT
ncbi:hypothetical protein BC940DRAFT_309504 [Gongronella butleri]|nr:hypothetical protein BC940DRAFT_309504 [Gongronella butleri]